MLSFHISLDIVLYHCISSQLADLFVPSSKQVSCFSLLFIPRVFFSSMLLSQYEKKAVDWRFFKRKWKMWCLYFSGQGAIYICSLEIVINIIALCWIQTVVSVCLCVCVCVPAAGFVWYKEETKGRMIERERERETSGIENAWWKPGCERAEWNAIHVGKNNNISEWRLSLFSIWGSLAGSSL